MLPREQRLTARRDFKRVYSGGRAFVNRLLVLRVLGKNGGQAARFGFSTSSKLGNAVLRNRMVRLLRESIRSLAGKIRETGFDAVVIVRPAARSATLTQIIEAAEDLLRKAKLLEAPLLGREFNSRPNNGAKQDQARD